MRTRHYPTRQIIRTIQTIHRKRIIDDITKKPRPIPGASIEMRFGVQMREGRGRSAGERIMAIMTMSILEEEAVVVATTDAMLVVGDTMIEGVEATANM